MTCACGQVTTEEDLEIIFSRFGTVTSCDIIRDHKTGAQCLGVAGCTAAVCGVPEYNRTGNARALRQIRLESSGAAQHGPLQLPTPEIPRAGDSLCYAFIGFNSEAACEEAYFKMNNVLVDDRRIKACHAPSVTSLT